MGERFVTETIHDKTLDVSLRPNLFADFAGQGKVKERLELAVEAAKQTAAEQVQQQVNEIRHQDTIA